MRQTRYKQRMVLNERTTYRDYLQREFEARSRRNASYSLRAFARDLGMPASKLSEALRGVCGLSAASAAKIAKKLQLDEKETELFISLVDLEHSRSKAGKIKAERTLQGIRSLYGFSELDLERFKIISDWYHFAILELTEVEDFQSSAPWIADRLQITKEMAEKAVERLMDFGLLKESKDGRWVQTQADLATPSGIPSRAIREYHSQILAKADAALTEVDIQERDFSAMTLAIPEDKMDEARAYLKEFRRKFSKDMENAKSKDRVYCLAIQFFPIDRKKKVIASKKERKVP